MPGDVPPSDAPKSSAHRWPVWLAWLVILGCVAVSVGGRSGIGRTAPQGAAKDDRLQLVVVELQGRYLVGIQEFFRSVGRDPADAKLAEQAAVLDAGSVGQRLRALAVLAEIGGIDEARERLGALRTLIAEHQPRLDETDVRILDLLKKLWEDPERTPNRITETAEDDKTLLVERLGWFGELILAAKGTDPAARDAVLAPALRTAVGILAAVVAFFFLGFVGLVLLTLFLTRAAAGRARLAFAPDGGRGRVCAETFALWFVLYPALSAAVSHAFPGVGVCAAAAAAMLLSLAALAWPLIRGVSWTDLRNDLGWTAGPGGWLEPLWGAVAYLMSLPWLALGLGITIMLMSLQKRFAGDGASANPFDVPDADAHPILAPLFRGTAADRLAIFFLASVAAPIVEETMFRGLLFRHLREATGRWGTFLSFAWSASLSSVIFAAVHPQGWVAIPVLAALAFGFAVAREWRGSLIASMVAHGISNGLVLAVALVALGR